MNWLIGICAGIGVLKTATTSREYCPTNRVSAMKAIAGPLVALAMPFVPALLLSLVLCLPTTASPRADTAHQVLLIATSPAVQPFHATPTAGGR